MKFAIIYDKKVTAKPKLKASCPICKEEVKARCGEVNQWHWAHTIDSNCEFNKESETEWHRSWKENFADEYQEIFMEKHIADININGFVVEFQNSTISKKDISERESFYDNMIWVINGLNFCKNLVLWKGKRLCFFKWKWASKAWMNCKKPLFVDMTTLTKRFKMMYEKLFILESELRIKLNIPEDEDVVEYNGNSYEFYNEYGEFVEVDNSKVVNHSRNLRIIKERYELSKNKILYIHEKVRCKPCKGCGEVMTKQEFIRKVKEGVLLK